MLAKLAVDSLFLLLPVCLSLRVLLFLLSFLLACLLVDCKSSHHDKDDHVISCQLLLFLPLRLLFMSFDMLHVVFIIITIITIIMIMVAW